MAVLFQLRLLELGAEIGGWMIGRGSRRERRTDWDGVYKAAVEVLEDYHDMARFPSAVGC